MGKDERGAGRRPHPSRSDGNGGLGVRRRALTALLCALLCCAAPAYASESAAAQIPDVLELRSLGIAVTLSEDWKALVAEGRLHFVLDYTLKPQEQTLETVALDIYFWPEPPPDAAEIALEEWASAGALRIASVRGSRRDAAARACVTKGAAHAADAQAPEDLAGPEQWALPDGGDYAYTLLCYPADPAAGAGLAETVERLLGPLRAPEAVIRTFAPEPLS